jgi:hypothetical protein
MALASDAARARKGAGDARGAPGRPHGARQQALGACTPLAGLGQAASEAAVGTEPRLP